MRLISEEAEGLLNSFSMGKKVAFLTLLFERMWPELDTFCRVAGLEVSSFERLRVLVWEWLEGGALAGPWAEFAVRLYDVTPDPDDFVGEARVSYALNVALESSGGGCCFFEPLAGVALESRYLLVSAW